MIKFSATNYEKLTMFNDKKSPTYVRRLQRQKVFLIGLTGVVGCGIIAGYLNFHNQVVEYTQSIVYREAQEATKDYTVKLMRRNQQLLLKDKAENKNR